MSKLVERFLKERAEYKKLAKETGEKKYESMSNNRKVKANGTYGIMGSPKHAFSAGIVLCTFFIPT
jgi:DNA polymerase elongation subunit (family B)